jgi:hypothetical protein
VARHTLDTALVHSCCVHAPLITKMHNNTQGPLTFMLGTRRRTRLTNPAAVLQSPVKRRKVTTQQGSHGRSPDPSATLTTFVHSNTACPERQGSGSAFHTSFTRSRRMSRLFAWHCTPSSSSLRSGRSFLKRHFFANPQPCSAMVVHRLLRRRC